MEFALECGFREMVVEGDNLSVMSALELKKSLSSRVGHIIQDVLCLPNGFSWSQVQFPKRSANTVTHLLARYAKQVSHDVIWTEESPQPVLREIIGSFKRTIDVVPSGSCQPNKKVSRSHFFDSAPHQHLLISLTLVNKTKPRLKLNSTLTHSRKIKDLFCLKLSLLLSSSSDIRSQLTLSISFLSSLSGNFLLLLFIVIFGIPIHHCRKPMGSPMSPS